MAGGGHCSLTKAVAVCVAAGHLPNHAVFFLLEDNSRQAGVLVHVCLSGSPSASHHEMEKMPKPPRSVEMKLHPVLYLHYRIENQHCLPRNNNTPITMVKSLQRSLEAKLASIEGV